VENAGQLAAGAANGKVPPASVYGGGPGQGITLPPYFKPTPSVVSASNFFPLLEELGPDEMRISFVGTCPFPPKRDQAATCIMVELGNGSRLFFDFGPGCLRNIAAFQVPVQDVNDIFITHLHVDHYGELPYLYAFAPWAARWKPLRVHGPSGRRPDEGIAHMIEGMQTMTHWHTKGFACGPVGDGYEVEVNEFDYEDDNGICYDKDGVTVRHWRRSHNMDGASAYRLDWNGLSFVWTGDGRPDTLTAKYAQGADVFVTELQPDLGKLMEQKTGIPQQIYNATIDMVHTDHYATGYVINQVQPRLGMVTHMAYDHEVVNEAIAGVRVHWKGLFVLGAPDGVVINVTKDAVWARAAVLPDSGNFKKPTTETELRQMFGGQIPATMRIPEPESTREELLSPGVRAIEIPPEEFVPADVLRPLITDMGKAFGPAMGKDIPVQLLFGAKSAGNVIGELTHALRSLASALNLLGGGLVGQALPDSPQAGQVKQQLGMVADMVKQATRQSDSIREAASAAVMGAAKSMQDQDQRADLKTAVAALVDVVTAAAGQLQQPEVLGQAKQTVSLVIDGVAAQLGSPAVQDGSADPTATLRTVIAASRGLAAGMLSQVLPDPGSAHQAMARLGRFGSSAMAGHDGTPALADALRRVGQMLQDPNKLSAVKSAASALIEALATIGGKLRNPDTQSALKGGAGLLIDGLGRRMAGLNGKPDGEHAAQHDVPAPASAR
jgi:ribonuclease Z